MRWFGRKRPEQQEEGEPYWATWARENIISHRYFGFAEILNLPYGRLLGCARCGALVIPTKEFQQHHIDWHRTLERS